SDRRSIDKVIRLWPDYIGIVEEKIQGDLSDEFQLTKRQIWGNDSPYKDNQYKDFKDLINFPVKLKHKHFVSIYREFDQYHFHGANFDLFGAIYEEFASQTKKKEFGEFYTRRHITGIVSNLLLRNELTPSNLKISDPSCGTGGFLTEAYKVLVSNYSASGKFNENIKKHLQENTFWGFDNDEKSVARTKLNMFLVGDGHTNIFENDSLLSWNANINWQENKFDYILTNPPMGQYDGEANIQNFIFTNERRNELMFTEKIVAATLNGGEIALVLNDGALEAPSRENFRIKLLQNCDIFAIISLSKFAFAPYTKEKTYVVFMQKKEKEYIGTIQKRPIWHYILDYDGYANSDKRFKTKYHDDIPELEEKFSDAVSLAFKYEANDSIFLEKMFEYERNVNQREIDEGLWGEKFGYTLIKDINESNCFNLLSEFHLRPIQKEILKETEFDTKLVNLLNEFDYIQELIIDYKRIKSE
ncbi:SAM-dependent methyltransferase, partial [Dolichospermum sp. ST_sed3]|nr:SAM-dependent methyltransferase [Dolichospermum sp. ST_sed3]